MQSNKELMQEVLNIVVPALRKQGTRSTMRGKGSRCRYRGVGETKCAIGHLIPDAEYHPSQEEMSLLIVVIEIPSLNKYKEIVTFLGSLRMIHDEYPPRYWESEWSDLARDYELVLPI